VRERFPEHRRQVYVRMYRHGLLTFRAFAHIIGCYTGCYGSLVEW